MGDGIEPAINIVIGAALSGLVGIVHGGLDSATEIPGWAHEAMNYAPASVSVALTASSKYGLKSSGERIGVGILSGAVSAGVTSAGYLLGRILVAGYKSVTG